jgi:signal transduction histidine kinase
VVTVVRDYIPRGNTLDAESFRQRHLLLSWILGLHLPALFLFGLYEGVSAEHAALEIAVPAALLVFARMARNRRVAAFFVTAGLVFCSSVLVHLSGGTIEAHFHFFILIGLIALYQDWVPFLWNVMFTVLSHGIGSAIAANLMYNHAAAQNRPWSWAVIHGVAVLAACVGVIIFWKNTEIEQKRSTTLAADLAAARSEAAQRASVSELFVNLARRNQSLLDRPLELIAELEELKRSPEALHELFQLDHLATRIRRNAESLLVLSGDDPPRRWGRPVPLGEVVRAAAAEVEEYQRIDVLVSEHLVVAGRAVADMAHLLAELLENATRFSPRTTDIRVRSYLDPGERTRCVLSIEDTGIGMSDSDLEAANTLLVEPPEIDLRARTLGLRVVSRLARRYQLNVTLGHTPGGGVTALVSLPEELVGERRTTPPPELVPVPNVEDRPPPPWPAPPPTPGPGSAPAPVPDPDSAPLSVPRARPTAPLRRAPLSAPAAKAPTNANGPTASFPRTSEGLIRRVPGAALSPVLRQRPLHLAPAPDLPADDRPNGTTVLEDKRSRLSRFQASQRAGRAIAVAPDGSLAHPEESGILTLPKEEDS